MPIASEILSPIEPQVKPSRVNNRAGEKSGKLTVLRFVDVKHTNARWLCVCECGKQVVIHAPNIGKTKSCGCLIGEHHGLCSNGKISKEYRLWSHIKERCYSPKAAHYSDYGGRGIKVCDRWLNSFPNFFKDMGKRPPGMTIDRKDTNGDYSPENCRWATNIEQQNNRRNNRVVEWNGVRQSLRQWERQLGFYKSTLNYRLNAGWSIERAMTEPVHVEKQRFKA